MIVDNQYKGGGFYAAAVPEDDSCVDCLINFIRGTGLPYDALLDNPFVDLMYSTRPPDKDLYTNFDAFDSVKITGFDYYEGQDKTGYFVANLRSGTLMTIHAMLKTCGCVHKFDTFRAQIVISNSILSKLQQEQVKGLDASGQCFHLSHILYESI